MKVALTVAGSDSGGGAGIQADLKTFHQFGVFGTSAITAITAQNTIGVTAWEPVRAELVRAQIDAVVSDLKPSALKTGMLGTTAIIRAIAEAVTQYGLTNYVLDPVMVATSGDLLIEQEAVTALRDSLLPLAAVVTPNADEAAVLIGKPVRDLDSMIFGAEQLVRMGARAALVKGGHINLENARDKVVDVLFTGRTYVMENERLETGSTHGTGCTLAAAITAQLASGVDLRDAVDVAIRFVHDAMRSAPGLGSGHGPLNHFVQPTVRRGAAEGAVYAGSSRTNARTSA